MYFVYKILPWTFQFCRHKELWLFSIVLLLLGTWFCFAFFKKTYICDEKDLVFSRMFFKINCKNIQLWSWVGWLIQHFILFTLQHFLSLILVSCHLKKYVIQPTINRLKPLGQHALLLYIWWFGGLVSLLSILTWNTMLLNEFRYSRELFVHPPGELILLVCFIPGESHQPK